MKNLVELFLLFISLIAVSGCKKDDVTPQTELSNGLVGLIKDQINASTQKFEVNVIAGESFKVKGKKGTEISFKKVKNKSTGANISGKVQVELIEIYDLADYVLLNKPMIGYISDSELFTLESDGSFFVKVTQDNTPIEIEYSLASRPNHTYVPQMRAMTYQLTNVADTVTAPINWVSGQTTSVLTPDEIDLARCGSNVSGTYCIDFINSNWCNIGAYFNYSAEGNQIQVALPEKFNNTNAKIYFQIKGLRSILPLEWDASSNLFSSKWISVTKDENINIIVVVNDDNKPSYSIIGTKVKATKEVISQDQLKPVSVGELRGKINGLL